MTAKNRIYGIHAVSNLLQAKPQLIERLLLQQGRDDSRLQSLIGFAEAADIEMQREPLQRLNQLFEQPVVHQGVVALCCQPLHLQEQDVYVLVEQKQQSCLLLVLDGVQDPHNLGACLRSANALGVDALIIPKDKSAHVNETAQKVACGAAALTPVIEVTNLARCLSKLQALGIWIVGLAGEASEPLSSLDLSGNLALVLGNEGSGLRRLTREKCDFIGKIPLIGGVDSLNVSVACGISLYEVYRQKHGIDN